MRAIELYLEIPKFMHLRETNIWIASIVMQVFGCNEF
jgi:hypothetical protein